MGLCRCPRKKVTNLFCFEHRVNVCDYCLVDQHQNCIVQSYLTWLQDSDYDAGCTLCKSSLSDAHRATVRLLCLHIYHLECLDRWASQLPAYTAPAGFNCPTCKEAVFPQPNMASPLVNALKTKLQACGWAKAGLGWSFVSPDLATNSRESSESDRPNKKLAADETVLNVAPDSCSNVPFATRKQTSESDINALIRQLQEPGDGNDGARSLDTDHADVKYKRRSALEYLSRWLRANNLSRPTVRPMSCRRVLFVLLLVVIGMLTLITIVSRSSERFGAQDDPLLDPAANPHLRNVIADKMYE